MKSSSRILRLRLGAAIGGASVLLAVVGIGACSGDTKSSGSGSGTGPTGPVPSNAFATTFATTFCDGIAACCQQAGISSSSCRATLEPRITGRVNLLLSNPKIAFDETAAANCINAYRTVLTACTDQSLSRQVSDACQNVFRGTVAVGGSCGNSNECAQPATGDVSCDTGVCRLDTTLGSMGTVHAAAGQPCSSTCNGTANSYGCSGAVVSGDAGPTTNASCWIQDGVFCSNGMCVALPAIGQPCGGGNYCAVNAHCQSGTCVADVATGPCTSNDTCVSTSYCDQDAGCTPLKANGTTCNTGSECAGGQCEQDRCRTWSLATAATCAGVLD
jgi:hypothetical protein